MSVRDTMMIDVSRWLTLSLGDSSDVQFASASQPVFPSIAFQDFICAHLWPHAFSGDKRTDADQATVVEWIVYDQRNEKRVCMNATSRSHLTVGWSGEGSYLSVHVFDHHVILFSIDQSTSFPYAILVTSSRDHQASNLSRPKETRPVKGWGWLRFQTGGLFSDSFLWFVSCLFDVRSWPVTLSLLVTVRMFNLLQPHNQSCHRSHFKILSVLTCDTVPFQVTKEPTLIKRQL